MITSQQRDFFFHFIFTQPASNKSTSFRIFIEFLIVSNSYVVKTNISTYKNLIFINMKYFKLFSTLVRVYYAFMLNSFYLKHLIKIDYVQLIKYG